ncbi:MAG: ion channel, partial [Halocynthiibacter sp.]
LISIILVLLTLCLHQASFVWLARAIPIGANSTHPGLYVLMLGVFAIHVVEILIYALGFYVAINFFELGSLEGASASGVLGHFYASAVFYTSLGFGDVLPNGYLRFIVSIEALNGLLLIAWSAAFIFAVMGKSWHCFSGPGAENVGDKTNANE